MAVDIRPAVTCIKKTYTKNKKTMKKDAQTRTLRFFSATTPPDIHFP